MWGGRADLCADSGWLIDHKGSYGDATELSCCSTERNNQDGAIHNHSQCDQWRG